MEGLAWLAPEPEGEPEKEWSPGIISDKQEHTAVSVYINADLWEDKGGSGSLGPSTRAQCRLDVVPRGASGSHPMLETTCSIQGPRHGVVWSFVLVRV